MVKLGKNNKTILDHDNTTGQFKPIPQGQKTPLMLEVEKRIGRTIEEEYQNLYIEQDWSQRDLAEKWNVKRSTIFAPHKRTGRRSWVKILRLPTKNDGTRGTNQISASTFSTYLHIQKQCECCNTPFDFPDRAHWIPASAGGSTSSNNILKLCPNCHRLLDRGQNQDIIERCKKILFCREIRKAIEQGSSDEELYQLTNQIINRII